MQERPWHRHYDPRVPRELDFERITAPEILRRTAGKHPDKPAQIFFGTVITYGALEADVNRFARALQRLGVREGDRVSLVLPNIPQFTIANYAAFRLGAVTVMNNPLYTLEELTYQFNDSESSVAVMLDVAFPLGEGLMARTGVKKLILASVADFLPEALKPQFPPAAVPEKEGVYHFRDLLAAEGGGPVENVPAWDDLGALLYTGGTTGVSKGVMLSHANISANISANVQQFRSWFPEAVDGEERLLAIYPFFHAAGWTGIQNTCIYAAWTAVLVPRPEPGVILELIEKTRPTLLPGVSTIFVALLNNERFLKMDLSFVKGYLTGAAPMAVETIAALKRVRDVPLINVYGLTEITPMGTATPWGGREKPETVGVPLPSTDLKIVDLETGERDLPIGETGEICFKGPQVMLGYYKKKEETDLVLKDGWLKTGDVGYLDADGYLTIVDRKKDLIISGGYNIYPREIDELLMTHPKVLEVCAVGVPDPYRGETVKVFVVARPGETLTAQEVISFCRERLAPYKVPRLVEFLDALPKSSVGKVLRRELRNRPHQA
ncbi:MAG TPA: long-chain fatty acid--CoA ligase [Syntrophales bacterium]|nr:long-chain fatty acid--CoA ligase [Syntrophales bacterium]HOM06635.1 long-chain fatty acid--CoA ligase [Syntrophales bacterium]HON99785.1 long-chain fatty acid--CoA ligase [Syntrophales bacterium]HPC01139.1 long-chain fatty acid--CoA ligase [Syntrophales bacterium]HPQ06296.1 long-chain fatty acid--CoA ligase [Syntrophales bacterium]